MKGVTFGEKHSYNDFSLLLAKVELGAPQAVPLESQRYRFPGRLWFYGRFALSDAG